MSFRWASRWVGATVWLLVAGLYAQTTNLPPAPPGFNQPFIAAFNNNYLGPVIDNIPIAVADPRNTEKYVFALIDRATSTLDVAFFDINDIPMINGLIRAHQRGVDVRVLTDTDNLRDREDPTLPRAATERLRRAGIKIRDDRRGAFMHHKFIIADGAAVWLGSMNLTTTSMYEHNNNGLIVRSRRLAANFQQEFNRLFVDGLFSGPRAAVPHPVATIGQAEFRVYFSPNGGTRAAVIEAIQSARQRIRIMAFSFTEESIAQAVIERHRAGVHVEAIFDDCLVDSRSQYYPLRAAGIRARRDGNQALMHHKVMVIDDDTVITGSYNFSMNAESSNNEALIIAHSHKLASAYLAEYERLRKAAIQNRDNPPYDHPACRRGGRAE